MRPINLSMTAFGPFAGREIVDFNAMGENPLFLINGPTGAGKTTLLDAICFALYGKTTGNEREGMHMRSDLAAAHVLTEVTLVFELAGQYYRIRRVPEQQKPKARGEGTTSHSPEAQLWRLNCSLTDSLESNPENEQLIVASKVKDATREIEELTGLNADQFRQVMVLPQGKFRQLLMAESKEREQIFSRLFQTHIYKQIEDRLKAQSAAIRQQVEQQRQRIEGVLEGAEVENLQGLSAEIDSLSPQLIQATLAKQQADTSLNQAKQALQQASQRRLAFEQLEVSENAYQLLLADSEAVGELRKRCDFANQANQINPAYVAMNGQKNQAQELESQSQQAIKQQDNAQQRLDQAKQQLDRSPELQMQLDSIKHQLTELKAHSSRAAELQTALQQQQAANTALQQLQSQQQGLKTQLQKQLENKDQQEHQVQQLMAQLDGLVGQQQMTERLQLQLEQVNELEQLGLQSQQQQSVLQRSEGTGKELKAQHQQSETQLKTLELNWHQGQAAILAKELRLHHPCPVCGSADHPHPAISELPLPSQIELEHARQQHQQLNQQLLEARESYLGQKKDLEHLRNNFNLLRGRLQIAVAKFAIQFSDEMAISEIKSVLTDLYRNQQQKLETLLGHQQQLKAIQQNLQQSKLTESELRHKIDAQQNPIAEQQAILAAQESNVARIERELPQDYRQPERLQQALAQAQSAIAEQENHLVGIRQQHQQASDTWHSFQAHTATLAKQKKALNSKLEELKTAWEGYLKNSAFTDLNQFQQALILDQQLREWQQQLQDYDHKVAELKGAVLQQRSVLEGQQKPELADFEQSVEATQVLHQQVLEQWQRLDRRIERLKATEQKLADIRSSLMTLEGQYALVGTLSDVANGQTGDKISLQRFVLSALLDDVLLEASQRLQMMSKGRYQLLRKEQRAKGNKASGLELEVEDAYTGKVRPVATLSGGESFMAALSMALGLSDVVQAYAGGIHLDTLFIDEGFGSLDADALDLAIRTLIDLQASGRMVGVISHVSELKEQMPIRMDVNASRDGSHIQLVLP